MKAITSLIALLINASIVLAQTTWIVDKAHTRIGFSALHMVIAEVSGEFREFDGKVVTDSDDFSSGEVTFSAKIASIDTENERRDNHLKSDDFFNAEKYPELKVTGTIQKEGDHRYLVGEMTIRDVTKPIKFDIIYGGTIQGRSGKKSGFKVTGVINRFDFDMKFDRTIETGGLVVSKEISITCTSELNEQTEEGN